MGLLKHLLFWPVTGPKYLTEFSLEKVGDVVRDNLTDDTPIKEELLMLQLKLESGEIDGDDYVRDIHDALKPAAVASRSNKPIGDRMILNAAFLVDRDREKAFDEAVKEISHRYEDLLTFKYTGPWPPYNFVNIKLKLEKATG